MEYLTRITSIAYICLTLLYKLVCRFLSYFFPAQKAKLDDLPMEVVEQIATYLTPQDVVSWSAVNDRYDQMLWRFRELECWGCLNTNTVITPEKGRVESVCRPCYCE